MFKYQSRIPSVLQFGEEGQRFIIVNYFIPTEMYGVASWNICYVWITFLDDLAEEQFVTIAVLFFGTEGQWDILLL